MSWVKYTLFVLSFLWSTHILVVQGCLYQATRELARPDFDSSVEIEITSLNQGSVDNYHHAFQTLLTTEDGTVGSLFKDKNLPDWFVDALMKKGIDRAREVKWDRLDTLTKRKLIVESARGQDYNIDRVIHGLKVRPELNLKFERETKFLGETYPPGQHRINLNKFTGGKVEFRTDSDIENMKGFEMHFRGNLSAGEMVKNAWTMLDGIKVRRVGLHTHIVAPIPDSRSFESPEVFTAVMGDYYRRVNLASEMRAVYHYGISLKTKEVGEMLYFDTLKVGHLDGVMDYLKDMLVGKVLLPIQDLYKMAYVGFRGSDKYDQPGLWGLEFRAITNSDDPKSMAEILNAVQQSMLHHDFGLDEKQMTLWLEKQDKIKNPDRAILGQLPNRAIHSIIENLHPRILSELTLEEKNSLKLLMSSDDRREHKMVFHNWLDDPIFFGASEEAQERILKAQMGALRKYQSGRVDDVHVVREFLMESGVYEATMKSINIRMIIP